MFCHVAWKKSVMFCHVACKKPVKSAHNCRPVSVCVQNQTIPATSAAIATTSIMIGFALMAAFSSHWAAVAAVSATLNALTKPTTV